MLRLIEDSVGFVSNSSFCLVAMESSVLCSDAKLIQSHWTGQEGGLRSGDWGEVRIVNEIE